MAAIAVGWRQLDGPADAVGDRQCLRPGRPERSSASPLGCAPSSRRCTAPVSAPSQEWTKSEGAPAQDLWSWPHACSGRTGSSSLAALDDSKKLNEKERERLFPIIRRYALAYHVVFIPSVEVDRRGVHVANIEGMRRAIAGLPLRPGYVLSDGFRVPGLAVPSLPVVGGDAAAACIAAASVLAKVSRDRLMVKMEADHPGYGFAEHKGYSTPAHGAALARLGPCSQHRYSFINVRRVVTPTGTTVVTELVGDCVPEQHGEVG